MAKDTQDDAPMDLTAALLPVPTDTVSNGGTNLFNQAENNRVYERYEVSKTYDFDPNIVPMAVASDAPLTKTAFVQLACPTKTLLVEWKVSCACNVGVTPSIPKSDPLTSNAILLRKKVRPLQVEADSDGTSQVLMLTGEYLYGFVDWLQAIENHAIPAWINGVPTPANVGTYKAGVIGSEA